MVRIFLLVLFLGASLLAQDAKSALERANQLAAAGRWEQALSAYTQAVLLDPNRTEAWRGRGLARRSLGDAQGALNDLTRALELDPTSALAYLARAELKQTLGDAAGAAADVKLAANPPAGRTAAKAAPLEKSAAADSGPQGIVVGSSSGGNRPLGGDTSGLALPASDPARPTFQGATEWVWLTSRYDTALQDLARALSVKYGEALRLPPAGLTAAQWAAAADLPGSNSTCLSAARAEFAAAKRALDGALAESYRRWVRAVSRPEPSAIVALWQAAQDIKELRRQTRSPALPTARQFQDSALEVLEAGLAEFAGSAKNFRGKEALETLLGNGIPSKAIGKARDFDWSNAPNAELDVKTQITQHFLNVLRTSDPAEMDALGTKLIRWADVALDTVAYGDGRDGDFRGLGGNKFFATGMALSLAEETCVSRQFGRRRVCKSVGILTTCRDVGPEELQRLNAGGSLPLPDPEGRRDFSIHATAADVPQLGGWLSELKVIQTDLHEAGERGRQAYERALREGPPARTLSAMRLLSQDLRRIAEDEQLTQEAKKFVLSKIAGKLAEAGGLTAALGPLAEKLGELLVEEISPDQRSAWADRLDRQSLALALSFARLPQTALVVEGGDAGLKNLLDTSAAPASACSTTSSSDSSSNTPVPAGSYKLLEVLADPEKHAGYKPDRRGDRLAGDLLIELAPGKFRQVSRFCEWCKDASSAPPAELITHSEGSYTFDTPPSVITPSAQGFELALRGKATCHPVRNNGTDCGSLSARFGGPGARVVRLTNDEGTYPTGEAYIGTRWREAKPPIMQVEAVYHFDTQSLPDEFWIHQIGTGAGTAAAYHYCRIDKCPK